MAKKSDLNSFEIRLYLLPKEEISRIYTCSIKQALKNIEDFELDELTEKAITEKITEYNKEKELKYFDRLKQKDFVLIKANIYKIGKYEYAKIKMMDNLNY